VLIFGRKTFSLPLLLFLWWIEFAEEFLFKSVDGSLFIELQVENILLFKLFNESTGELKYYINIITLF
jgi:hypothetical protein